MNILNQQEWITRATPIALLTALLGIAMPADASQSKIRLAKEPVKNEYIVVLNNDLVPRPGVREVANSMAKAGGGKLLAVYEHGLRGYAVRLPPPAAERLAEDPRVAFVEENSRGHLSYTEEWADRAWHLDRIDQRPSVAMGTRKYGYTSTGTNADVYIIDTGVQILHTEFSNGNVQTGVGFSGEDGYTQTNPCGGFISLYNGGHGTAVASLVAGRTVGVARGAQIIPVKVGRCDRVPLDGVTELQIDAIAVLWGLDWVMSRVQANPTRRAVVNMSLYFDAPGPLCPADGTHSQPWDCRPALEHNIRNLLNSGVVVVASANNQYTNNCANQTPARMGYGGVYDPGNQEDWNFVITVGGTDIQDKRYKCETCDPQDRGSNHGPCVSIYAPAHFLQSAHIAAAGAYRDEGIWLSQAIEQGHYFGTLTLEAVASGTSFASPVVAGMVARLLQTYPNKSVRKIWDHLKETATPLPENFDEDGVLANDKLAFISVYE